METFEISYYTPESDQALLEYYWANGTALPYMKECPTLRIYKADHFAVIVAGRVTEKMQYKLDLTASNNVNIDCEDLIIDTEVPGGQLKQLAVIIANAENWFLCAKKIYIGPILESPKEAMKDLAKVVMKRDSLKST